MASQVSSVVTTQIKKWEFAFPVLLYHWRCTLRGYSPFKIARDNPEELRERGHIDPKGFQSAAKNCNIPLERILALDTTPLSSPAQSKVKGLSSWRTLLTHGEKDWIRFDDEQISREMSALFFFSSGTTGLPKLTKLTHYNLVAQHMIVFEHFPRPYVLKRLVALPMFHAATAPSVHISPLRGGHPQVIMRRFDPVLYLEYADRHQVTDFTMVPPLATVIINHPMPLAEKRQLLKNVKHIFIGAAPLDAVTQSRFKTLLPESTPFTQVFGMTETSCFASIFPYPEQDTTGSVGRFIPNLDVKLIDDEGRDITAYDTIGELAIRGPTITPGYVGVPRERDFDAEGYFRTGDVMYMDKKTKLWYIVDRKKELIKVRGFQVAPAELEGVLLDHPSIRDAAVIAVKGADGSELPRAYVVKRQGVSLKEEEITAWIAGKLSKYKHLEGGVRFVESIPVTPSGKILKRILREMAEKENQKAKL